MELPTLEVVVAVMRAITTKPIILDLLEETEALEL
tara:strand:+ start:525 stop:629 length:105 start_codon:yes stop_codon:yes gene_type:complete